MKYIVLIPDGSADEPREELGGQTPLQAAVTPNFDRLAREGTVGLAHTIPPGFPPGSDVANMCVLGYDPHLYYTGRAPLEAASLDIDLPGESIAFRCNLVYVEDGIMRDFSAGHITTGEADQLISFLEENLGGTDASFHTGLSYRHIMVSKGRAPDAKCTPPHDITGRPIAEFMPRGEGANWVIGLMEASTDLLAEHPVNLKRVSEGKFPANMIWLWGQGKAPSMPTLTERFGLTGSVISAVDLVKGLGKYAGLKVVEVPGATGWLDTDYAAKGRYALKELESVDFIYVHVEAPDEASHSGDTAAKVNAIERFDAELVGTILEGISEWPEHKLLIVPDHATPISIKTHNDEPVPFLVYKPGQAGESGYSFDEKSAAGGEFEFEQGWKLMEWFLEKKSAGT